MLLEFLALIATFLLWSYVSYQINARRVPAGLKKVPVVKGCLPIVGHGLQFSKDIIGFVRACEKEYGNIFRVKIFRTDMIIICDREMLSEFFKASENNLSLYKTLNRLFFGSAFADDDEFLGTIIQIVKETIRIKYDDFIPKIRAEADKMIQRIINKNGSRVIISDEMMKFVACTSARCFIGIELSDTFYDTLMTFAHILNKVVVSTYFFPKWFLRRTVGYVLQYYRQKMINELIPLFNEYRNNPDLNDSMVVRRAVDYTLTDGSKLSDSHIGGILICLLYVSTENTALALSATMADLGSHPDYWKKARIDTLPYLLNNDTKGLFKQSKIIDACFNESSRLNTHIFPLNRFPTNPNMSIGGYYVGNATSVGICAPMLMNYDRASDIFDNPLVYNPDRFTEDHEPSGPLSILSFGAYTHLCPGRLFAKMEIKMAMALITNTFKCFNIDESKMQALDYFSPSAFAERHVPVNFVVRNKSFASKKIAPPNNDAVPKIVYNGKILDVITYPGGWLLKSYFSISEQKQFYEDIVKLSVGSDERNLVNNFSEERACPLTYYNLVYTHTSNCEEPRDIFSKCKGIWNILTEHYELPKSYEPNSLYAQLFHENTTMSRHKDNFCDWGMSITLGATTILSFGNDTIELDSGDILIADFSKVEHGVVKVTDEVPGWFNDDYEGGIEVFNQRTRMSIQIRQVDNSNEPISMDEFIQKILTGTR
jgi:cytochrome P450